MPKSQAIAVETDALSVFVSYSRRDMATADALVNALESRGVRAFIDRRDLPYGEKWQVELADSIAASDTVIWLVSPDSVGSKWCNWELDEVQKQHKRLVPVRVGPVAPEGLPRQLGQIHILPAEGQFDLDNHFDSLVRVLETDRGWLKEHTRLLDRAQQWIAKERGDGLLLRGRALADAESWQTRQPLRAPQPSPEILDLILTSQKGAKRRQRTLIGSLLGGLAVAIGLAALAGWQYIVAEAQSARVIRETALSSWRAFDEPRPECLQQAELTQDFGQALLSAYCTIEGVMSFPQLEELSGLPAFVSGPHTGGRLNLREERDFGHYNLDLIVWVENNIFPDSGDTIFINATKGIYEKNIQKMARAFHRAYVGWSQNLPHFSDEQRYLVEIIDGTRPWTYIAARYQNDSIKSILGIDIQAEELNWYHLDTALRYWLRRSIDGSAEGVFRALKRLMSVYDADWLAAAPMVSGQAPHLPPPGTPIEMVFTADKPRMPEPR